MDNNDFMYVVIVCKYDDINEDKSLQILIRTSWTMTVPVPVNMVITCPFIPKVITLE